MAQPGYTRKDLEQHLFNLLGQNMIDKIPQEEWDQLDDFADYIAELYGVAMQNTHGGTLRVHDYENFLREYDARMQNLLRKMNVFAGNNGTMMADLFGTFGHFSPHYLVFDNAKTKLMFLVLVKIYYSFIKQYGEDGPNSETIGNQRDLQSFVYGDQ